MTMLLDVVLISLTVGAVIALLLIFHGKLLRRYAASRFVWVWLILAVRLLIPFRAQWENAPVQLPVPEVLQEQNMETSTQMAPAAEKTKPIPLLQVLSCVWAAGAVGVLGFHLVGYGRFRRCVKPHLVLLEQGEKRGGFYVDPAVYRCSVVQSPLMLGYFRPMILLPDLDYTPEERMAVLLHERAHFRRRDVWLKLLLLLANAVHWFNPLVWLMVRKASEDLETACDEAVTGTENLNFRKEYSRAILKTAEGKTEKGEPPCI